MNEFAKRLGVIAAGIAVVALIPLGAYVVSQSRRPAPVDISQVQDWAQYGGPTGGRFSPLTQINTANVATLQEAWRFDAGPGGLQTSPLIHGRMLYAYTADQKIIALDGATGRLIWTFDSGLKGRQPSRGLSLWQDGGEVRLLAGVQSDLWALDPATGRPIPSFGTNGKVDLRQGLGNDPETNATFLTSPGVIYRDLIIVGFRTSENKPAAPGALRAYDVRTGRQVWTFHFIPRPGGFGTATWPQGAWKEAGAANAWAGLAIDPENGIVFAPTGSAVNDFYGADRKGDNLFANSLVAIDARTGKRIWHFQGVHHDIWDRDFPSPPVLLTVERVGRRIEAVAQTSKQGFVYLFDRRSGRPLFPIEERAVPQSTTPGEWSSPTQPFPTAPAPFARQHLTEDMLTRRTQAAADWARTQFRTFISGPQFTPLSVGRQTVVFPGFDGGAEWGGPAVDPQAGILYVNANDLAWTGGLAEAESPSSDAGARVYQEQCSACHGSNRQGSPPEFPSLVGIGARYQPQDIAAILAQGRGRMPAFPSIAGADRDALIAYLRSDGAAAAAGPPTPGADREVASARPAAAPARYRFTGYKKFLDPDGYPAVAPPWGTLSAIDMNTGRYLWKVPLGEYPALTAQGVPVTGSENYGGPIITAGGVLFIGATVYDRLFRAFDRRTGLQLWQASLPFAGVATPATYMIDGRQYVVIAASGARDRAGPQGSAYVAYALPSPRAR